MEALISFDFAKMKEYIKIGNKSNELSICSSFIDVLSLDTDYIENEIIKKTNFNDMNDVKKAYKKAYKMQPLLFIDEFNLINHLDNFSNPQKTIQDYNHSISQLSKLIEDQKEIDANSTILNELNDNLKFLKQKRKNYIKITKNLSKYVNTIFSVILNRIDLYRNLVQICYLNNVDAFFKGFSQLSPLNKFIFYNKFEHSKNNLFNNLPSSNINFTFSFSSNESREDFKKKAENNPEKALKLLFEENISTIYEYNCKNFEQFLQISFFTCLTKNFNIKKCENCGKYFIAYQRSDEKYCNRNSPQDKNKTCKQYTNFENWKNNINSNEELKTYRRIYMAKQMQTRRNPDNLDLKNNFEMWKKEAQKIRNEYIHGHLNKKDFLDWLNTNS
ncbi:MAG: DUF6076 domain-containing protein [Clostridia bacterium]|nr:DUF6076 domain-containing protein [Clostridia bacterium]